MFEDNIKRLEEVQKIAGFSDAEIELMKSHTQITEKELEVDGVTYPAWRIVHNRALGPGKGGIRFHPDASIDEVKSLSFWMSLKNSLVGLPMGGGKGAVKIDGKNSSPELLEKVSRAYAREFASVIGEKKDIPAPDMYTNGQIMAWMLDEYEKVVGHCAPGVITGKPIELGGIKLRADSTSKGGVIVFGELSKFYDLDKSATVAVQGFGNAGYHVARMLSADGYKVVAVSDSQGGIYKEDGLDIEAVAQTKEAMGSVTSSVECDRVTNGELLELDVDVMFLAAMENQITDKNADQIKAKHIIELANGPITLDADKILNDKGVVIVPDILANAGGVLVSYFEWCQNLSGGLFDERYLANKLEDMMTDSFSRVYNVANEKKISLRQAAYVVAMKRILVAEKLRGNIK
jgi:glutamate dehydrogenase/leucine dehydrogenase